MYWLWTFAGAVRKRKCQYQCIFFLFYRFRVSFFVCNKNLKEKLWNTKHCDWCTYLHKQIHSHICNVFFKVSFSLEIIKLDHYNAIERENCANKWALGNQKKCKTNHLNAASHTYEMVRFCCVICWQVIILKRFYFFKWFAPKQ